MAVKIVTDSTADLPDEIVKELGVPCVFIRYNPDDKKSDYNCLLEMVKDYLEKDMDEIDFDGHSGLKVEYLFYQTF